MTGPDFLTYFYIYFCLCLITVSDDLSMMWCLIGTVILWMYCINIIVKFFQWSQIVYRIGRSRGGWIACCPVIYIYTHPRFVRKGRTELSTKHVLKQICCLLCLIKMSFSWNFFDRIAKDWSISWNEHSLRFGKPCHVELQCSTWISLGCMFGHKSPHSAIL